MLYSRSLLVTCLVYSRVFLLIPNSLSPPFLFGNHKFVFEACDFSLLDAILLSTEGFNFF